MVRPHADESPAASLRARCLRRPLRATLLLTLLWHGVLVLLATVVPVPAGEQAQDVRAAAINLVAALLPLTVVAALAGWRQSGLTGPVRDPRWLLLLVVVAALPALRGLSASGAVVTTVALQLCLGLDEELLSRGLVQPLTAHLGGWRCATWVGLLFGAGHALNAVVFGASWFDAGGQVLSGAATGFCFAAVRFHVLSLWPFVVLHAAENALRDLSGALGVPVELALAAALVAYGCLALRRLAPGQVEAVALASSGDRAAAPHGNGDDERTGSR